HFIGRADRGFFAGHRDRRWPASERAQRHSSLWTPLWSHMRRGRHYQLPLILSGELPAGGESVVGITQFAAGVSIGRRPVLPGTAALLAGTRRVDQIS